MKDRGIARFSILILFLILSYRVASAQTNRIIVVPIEDTTLVDCHVGATLFSNSVKPLNINIPMAKYIENKLNEYLSTKYEVTIACPPAEITRKAYGFLEKSKEFKSWLNEKQKSFDIVILIRNIDIRNELMNAPIPTGTSGFYRRGRMHGVYTTISFQAYRVSNGETFEYYESHKAFSIIKNIKLPKGKEEFDESSLHLIEEEMYKLQDSRIKYFLGNTYLIPELKGLK